MRADVPHRTRDHQGKTPLHHAAQFGHISVLRILVEEMRRAEGGGGGLERATRGDVEKGGLAGDNTFMMDGGPFK